MYVGSSCSVCGVVVLVAPFVGVVDDAGGFVGLARYRSMSHSRAVREPSMCSRGLRQEYRLSHGIGRGSPARPASGRRSAHTTAGRRRADRATEVDKPGTGSEQTLRWDRERVLHRDRPPGLRLTASPARTSPSSWASAWRLSAGPCAGTEWPKTLPGRRLTRRRSPGCLGWHRSNRATCQREARSSSSDSMSASDRASPRAKAE